MIGRNALYLVGVIGMSFVVGGCQPYLEEFEYLPHPAIVEMGTNATQPVPQLKSPLTVYATVVGVRSKDVKAHLPLSVEVRVRFDDSRSQKIEFDPQSLDLVTGELFRFAPPIVQPPQAVSLGSGESVVLQANFPFPPGTSAQHIHMGTLLLHWRVRIDGRLVPQSAKFHRIDPDFYYDPRKDVGYELGYPYVGGNAEVQYPE